MRVALLGVNDLVPGILRALAGCQEVELVAACEFVGQDALLLQSFPHAALDASWESLLARDDLNAVIVAGDGTAERVHQLKRLVQEGVPVLVTHPSCDVMEAYEVEWLRRESGSRVAPYAPGWFHPAWQQLLQDSGQPPESSPLPDRSQPPAEGQREEAGHSHDAGREAPMSVRPASPVRDDSSGAAEVSGGWRQVLWECGLEDRSQLAVLRQFSRDALLIQRLLGPALSVSAFGVQPEDRSFANITIHCGHSDQRSVRWSLLPPRSAAGSRITLIGESSTTILHDSQDGGPWTIEREGRGPEAVEMSPSAELGETLRNLAGAEGALLARPDWSDVCAGLETVDAAKRSLRRKRAIDLNVTERSETSTFKGYMAAAGCLILVVMLLVMVALAVVEGFRMPLREPAGGAAAGDAGRSSWPFWLRIWPVYPLLVFLGIQFLLVLTRRSPPQPAGGKR